MRPLFERVLLHRPKRDKIGSILVPEAYRHRHAREIGVLVDAGETCAKEIRGLIGATVMIGKMSGGDWIKDGEVEWWICDQQDLLCVVEESPTPDPAAALKAVA